MATIFVVIADIGPYEANEMTLAEDDYVLEELSTTAADPALGRPVLPRAAVGDANRLCAIALMNSTTAELKIESRSKMRYLGTEGRGVVGKRLT